VSEAIRPDIVPDDYASPIPHLELLIEHINLILKEQVRRNWPYDYERKDGGRDRFRCVIKFSKYEPYNLNESTRLALLNAWRDYHVEMMDAYRQVGWTVDLWFEELGDRPHTYCISLPQVPIDRAIAALQDRIERP
jgi:hypothetical protein